MLWSLHSNIVQHWTPPWHLQDADPFEKNVLDSWNVVAGDVDEAARVFVTSWAHQVQKTDAWRVVKAKTLRYFRLSSWTLQSVRPAVVAAAVVSEAQRCKQWLMFQDLNHFKVKLDMTK